MDAVAPGLLALLGGEGDLRIDVPVLAPGRLQALEGGAVVETDRRGCPVEALDVDRLATGWRPGGGVEVLGDRFLESEDAAGVAGPGNVPPGLSFRTGIDQDLVVLSLLGIEGQLQLHRSLLGYRQRRLQDQLLQMS